MVSDVVGKLNKTLYNRHILTELLYSMLPLHVQKFMQKTNLQFQFRLAYSSVIMLHLLLLFIKNVTFSLGLIASLLYLL